MNNRDLVQEIMIMLQKKHNHVNRLLIYTQDIIKSLSQNDLGSVEMILGMRYRIMLDIENCDEEIRITLSKLSDDLRLRLTCQMSEFPVSSEVSFEEKKINEIYTTNKNTLKKIVESDNIINSRIKAISKLAAIDAV